MRHVGTPKVLVVDDEEWMRDACVEILQPEGFEVMTAADGPGMDGLAYLGSVKAFDPDIVAMMITGCACYISPRARGMIEPVAQRADPTIRFVDDWPRSLPTITPQHSAKPPLDMQPATLLALSGKAA
jgi:hypothetical protein